MKLESGSAHFADFKSGELEVHAMVDGDAQGAIDYLRATPVDAMAGGAFSTVEASGPLQANVDVFLPFRDFVNRRILVHARVAGASIARLKSPLAATDVSGEADIDGGQVARADFRGRLLGGAFRAQARSPKNRRVTRTQLEVRGTFAGEALRKAMDLPPAVGINGLSDWHAILKMAPEPARERSLHVSSSLAGLEFKLPEPLAKPYGRPLPSWFESNGRPPPAPRFRLALGRPAARPARVRRRRRRLDARPRRHPVRCRSEPVVTGDSQIVNIGGTVAGQGSTSPGWLPRLRSPDKDSKPLVRLPAFRPAGRR